MFQLHFWPQNSWQMTTHSNLGQISSVLTIISCCLTPSPPPQICICAQEPRQSLMCEILIQLFDIYNIQLWLFHFLISPSSVSGLFYCLLFTLTANIITVQKSDRLFLLLAQLAFFAFSSKPSHPSVSEVGDFHTQPQSGVCVEHSQKKIAIDNLFLLSIQQTSMNIIIIDFVVCLWSNFRTLK